MADKDTLEQALEFFTKTRMIEDWEAEYGNCFEVKSTTAEAIYYHEFKKVGSEWVITYLRTELLKND